MKSADIHNSQGDPCPYCDRPMTLLIGIIADARQPYANFALYDTCYHCNYTHKYITEHQTWNSPVRLIRRHDESEET